MHLLLSPRLESQQIMIPAMQQALRILQMPHLELADWIRSEIEANPLLEEISYPTSFMQEPRELSHYPAVPTLHEHLFQQARETLSSQQDLSLISLLINHLDDNGWLTTPLEDLSENPDLLRPLLSHLQTFHPQGVGARNLQESLLLQLSEKDHTAQRILQNHFEDLLKGRFSLLQKKLRLSKQQLQVALQKISRCKAHPVTSFFSTPTAPLIPDLCCKEQEWKWEVEAQEEFLPHPSLTPRYVSLDTQLLCNEERQTVKGWKTRAKWLFQCIKRRREILLKIGTFLLRHQVSFFSQEGPIISLSLSELAQFLNVHEATARRALANKHLACPCGIIPLKRFFLSPTTGIKEELQSLILQENKFCPLTDEALVDKLNKKGFCCARRTVAKYRSHLSIPTAPQRKALCASSLAYFQSSLE